MEDDAGLAMEWEESRPDKKWKGWNKAGRCQVLQHKKNVVLGRSLKVRWSTERLPLEVRTGPSATTVR